MAHEIKLTMDGMLLNWLKEVGEQVSNGDVIAEVESDKATVEIEAPADGVLLSQNAAAGEELSEGAILGYIGTADEAVPAGGGEGQAEAEAAPVAETQPASQLQPPTPTNGASTNGAALTEDGRLKASPIARRIAAERGIDLQQVTGTGPGGRIVKKDVETFTPSAAPTQATPAVTGIPAQATYGAVPEGADVEEIELTRLRKRIAENMVLSKQQIPHFLVTTDMDVAALLDLRQQLNADLGEGETKISINDLIVKATALALTQFPNLNSHWYGDRIIRHKRINIGIAVALPQGGLMTVVAHDADRTALGTLAAENKARIARAREGKVKPEDFEGATFTVSNLGIYDVDHFVAIINPPEAGILAIGSAKQVPIVNEDGTLGVGNRMKVTISVDHRVSDGAEAAAYLQYFKGLIENPIRLLR
ncbi:MAG: 2-oxo acid dehydrogenase subunit E2 [Chloroflexi bacterium]|nr:MAG: 2-oxo acid dehydrogenase subunit E2 [Chloroflexota bacterium]